ncbi:MAG: hypothetical protein KJ017_02935 [Alphaproteobacteria bacterium]|nr:hypothetical protein [Alphaproteobacteria bacterium]
MTARLQTSLVWLIALLMLAPWAYVHTQAMVNGNVAWLLIAAGRMIEGQPLVQAIYETNPPLTILLYAPHILVMKTFGLPPEIGPLLVTLAMLLLSLIASAATLNRFHGLNHAERTTFLLAQTAALTSLSAIYFMDREHLMLMALIPFFLAQIALTEKIALPRALLWPIMICGTIAVLIKPQYGLIPAALLLHRLIAHRTLRVLKDPDFLALAIGTIIYLSIIILAFRDYTAIILPDVLDYYLGSSDKANTLRLFQPHFVAYLALLFLELFMEDLEKPKKRLLIALYACAVLSLVPLLVQMKGFYNHLLPAFGIFIIALSMTIMFRLQRWLGKRATIALLLAPIAIFGAVGLLIKPAWNYPKGYEIRKMPVARFLDENCPKPCTFFAFHGDLEIMNPTAFYSGYTHGSRYPSYWFLPRLLKQIDAHENSGPVSLSIEELTTAKERFSLFALEDLDYFKPQVLLIGTNIDIMGKGEFLNFVEFFSSHERFKVLFEKNYEKTGTFEFDRAEYFRGTSLNQSLILTYDVYKLKNRTQGEGESESDAGLKTNNQDPM